MDTNQFSETPNYAANGIVPRQSSTDADQESRATVDERVKRTFERTWQMLDEIISPADLAQLETDLLTCPEAREKYREVVSFETELRHFFQSPQQPPVEKPSN